MKCDVATGGVVAVDEMRLRQVGAVLTDSQQPLKNRFRALFTLQNIGGAAAIELICSTFSDSSALLKHELAYCLGQMGDSRASARLSAVLQDAAEDAMVRHEAGEALGAIGDESALPLLDRMSDDVVREVAETCRLAAARIRWLQDPQRDREQLSDNPYRSVDPAPPSDATDPHAGSVDALRAALIDEQQPLWHRYRAMFALRNRGDDDSVLALADALQCSGALFKHEVAYVLGQMAHAASVTRLTERLADPAENYMVRHECAEALGAIATDACYATLERYRDDPCRVVRESCVVALDMCEHEQSGSFQYANALTTVSSS